MMQRWVLALVLSACVSGCAVAPRGLTEPVMEVATEPVMEAAVVATAPRRVAGPVMRPRARPAWVGHCTPGDDGIGGTGCPVD